MDEKQAFELLKQVKYPGFSRDIVSFGIVKGIHIDGENATVDLEFSTSKEEIIGEVTEKVAKILSDNGIVEVDVNVSKMDPKAEEKKKEKPDLVPGVKHIIAVASGKGGVGKSTIAANLAIGLSRIGLKVGLMDADIYGPSVQMLLGLNDEPEPVEGEKKIYPMEAYGIKAMSMGVLIDTDTALVWRGPMVSSAVEQLLRDVKWGELDVLVLDMPPGTGDIQLTVAQKLNLSGAVIVTTPQNLALLDARKGTSMFQKVEVPVLGLVENMSYFLCPHCGERTDVFSTGGAKQEALRLRVPLLGEVPLVPEIRESSDSGKPPAAGDGELANVFQQIAERVWASVETK